MATSPLGPGDISLRDFIEAIGSADAGHGAVSTAAVAGGLGSSLLLMVAALTSDEVRLGCRSGKAGGGSGGVSRHATAIDGNDRNGNCSEALHRAQHAQGERAQRSDRQDAIQLALRASADVPLEVMRLCAQGLELAATVSAHGARAASADLQLGVALLQAGFDGAHSNLEGKLRSFIDAAYITSIVDEIGRLTGETAASTRAAESWLKKPPA
jgi:formiminotetrahydrofolate cyclodeaminase